MISLLISVNVEKILHSFFLINKIFQISYYLVDSKYLSHPFEKNLSKPTPFYYCPRFHPISLFTSSLEIWGSKIYRLHYIARIAKASRANKRIMKTWRKHATTRTHFKADPLFISITYAPILSSIVMTSITSLLCIHHWTLIKWDCNEISYIFRRL